MIQLYYSLTAMLPKNSSSYPRDTCMLMFIAALFISVIKRIYKIPLQNLACTFSLPSLSQCTLSLKESYCLLRDTVWLVILIAFTGFESLH